MARVCYDDPRYELRTVLAPPAAGPRATLPPEVLWFPGAVRRPLPVNVGGTLVRSRGLVLHVQAGDNSPYGWFSQETTKASAHWWVGRAGLVEQYAPADRIAWAEAAGNAAWHSVETEGFPGEGLTAEQIAALAALYAWGHDRWGWTLGLAETPDGTGLGWHGMGGAAWGGHFDCPGEIRRGQRQQIINVALGGGEQEEQMPTVEEIAAGVWGYPPTTEGVDRRAQKPTYGAVLVENYNKAGDIQAPRLTGIAAKIDAIGAALHTIVGPDHPAAAALAAPAVLTLDDMRAGLAGLSAVELVVLAADALAYAKAFPPVHDTQA